MAYIARKLTVGLSENCGLILQFQDKVLSLVPQSVGSGLVNSMACHHCSPGSVSSQSVTTEISVFFLVLCFFSPTV